jgi:hypothetical protein
MHCDRGRHVVGNEYHCNHVRSLGKEVARSMSRVDDHTRTLTVEARGSSRASNRTLCCAVTWAANTNFGEWIGAWVVVRRTCGLGALGMIGGGHGVPMDPVDAVVEGKSGSDGVGESVPVVALHDAESAEVSNQQGQGRWRC